MEMGWVEDEYGNTKENGYWFWKTSLKDHEYQWWAWVAKNDWSRWECVNEMTIIEMVHGDGDGWELMIIV